MKKDSLKHQAYEAIKNNIINCVYAPNTIINEELIREQVDASRTPIRDALSRLEQEGLVRILPKKGILITGITLNELNMLYETRFLLEPYAVRSYGKRISQDVYIGFYQRYTDFLNNPAQPYSFGEMDNSFHQAFINATENSYFINIYSTIENQISRIRILTGQSSAERLNETIEEHIDIVKAALTNDWDTAAEAMENHLRRSKNCYFDYLLQRKDAFS